jgi:hypothetical protein
LTRVERDGVEQPSGSFDIATGEQVSGVRLIISYGTAVIRGQLKIVGGPPPPGFRLGVRLNRAGTNSDRPDWLSETDARFRFLFEGLAQGDYEVIVTGTDALAARKQVTLSHDTDVEITIVIDLSAKDKDK